MEYLKIGSLCLIAALITACGSDSGSSDSDSKAPKVKDADIHSLIETHHLSGDPTIGRDLPDIRSPKAQLGMQLFFTKALGGDQDTACVTCHHPALGGGDNLSLPLGVGSDKHNLLGVGRTIDGSLLPNVPRNAPTTFNIALWDQVLFHDGRVESLSKVPGMNGAAGQIRTPDSAFGVADENAGLNLTVAQARFPVTSAAEMRGEVLEAGNSNDDLRNHLAARLSNTGVGAGEIVTLDADSSGENDWVEQFEAVYENNDESDLITYGRIADAIAAYEGSQVFVNNSWKAYVQGDNDALTESQKRGAVLFYETKENGGAACVDCHKGDFFTDEKFYNIAMIQIGEGKGDGAEGTDDFGRFRETKEWADKYAFRAPSLLNVAVTKPYGHAGAYDSLEDVIKHHLSPELAIDDFFANEGTWCQKIEQFSTVEDCDHEFPYAESNTRLALWKLNADRTKGFDVLSDVELSDAQVDDLVNFMSALTDRCLLDTTCLEQWIPDTQTNGPTALQVNGVDENDQPLVVNQ